jgi:hypothetical protein
MNAANAVSRNRIGSTEGMKEIRRVVDIAQARHRSVTWEPHPACTPAAA